MQEKDWDRISEDYYKEVISPIRDSDKNPLFDDLEKFSGKEKSVIELGCGLGEMAQKLSHIFGHVVAIDFSKGMIEKAKEKNSDLKNAEFHVRDMNDLEEFKDSFDVAISINSLLTPDVEKINNMIQQIYSVLKPGGKLLAIVPSMESYIYQSMIMLDRKLNRGVDKDKAVNKATERIEADKNEMVQGIISFDGDSQKAFYGFEIVYRFSKAGFKEIKTGKVLYSWKEWSEAGQEYFPKEDKPWDWYFYCEKPL